MEFIDEFDALENLSVGKGLEDIEKIFHMYVDSLANYISIEPIHKNVRIQISKEKLITKKKKNNPFDIGVVRSIQDKFLYIDISQDYIKFLPFILLREAYNIFLPKKTLSASVTINSFVEKNLRHLNGIDDWKLMIREFFIHDEYISTIMTTYEKLYSETANIIQIFFNLIKSNITVINKDLDDLVMLLQEEVMLKISEILYDNEMVETLRILIDIFYEVKYYNALLDYKEYFKEFKEKNMIRTKLSLRKFTSNMKLISNNSLLSPSYKVHWNAINVSICFCYMKFHPLITTSKINKILKDFPFLLEPRISYSSGFGPEILGYFAFPKKYLLDFISVLKKMKNLGYLSKLYLFQNYYFNYFINLNFLREFHNNESLINPFHNQYEKKFEINTFLNYGFNFHQEDLDLLDFLIFDKIRFFSTNSFGFERRENTLESLKNDIIEEITYQRNLINDIKEFAISFLENPEISKNFINFLEPTYSYGLFYLKNLLDELLLILSLIEKYHRNNPKIRNSIEFAESIKKHGLSSSLGDNLLLQNKLIKKLLFKEFIPLYFNNKKLFSEKINQLILYNKFLNICFNLKIFNLRALRRIIEKPEKIKEIYNKKELKLKEIYEAVKLRDITSKEVEDRIARFLNHEPPIVKPYLLNTIPYVFAKSEFFGFIIRNNEQSLRILNSIKSYVPRLLFYKSIDMISNEDLIFAEIRFPNFHYHDAYQFYSILFNNFKENLIIAKRNFYSGFTEVFSLKNLYDLEKGQFFYTKDLFKQYDNYLQKILGDPLEAIPVEVNKTQSNLFLKENKMTNLVKSINNRLSKERIDFNIKNLNMLRDLNVNLNKSLTDLDKFKQINKEPFFKKYVKSIHFIPSFQQFGFDQFFLYLCPTNVSKIDLKLLFLNTFQQIKVPLSIDNPIPFLIKYIMPYNTPNDKYLHWLVKSKKIIQEYSLFSVKKIYILLHFDYNLTENGWEYDADKFKSHLENILFKPGYDAQIPKVSEYNISKQLTSPYYDPESEEYEALTQIYNRKSLNIKTHLGTRNYKVVNSIKNLLNKKLIFPYLSLKNLGFQDKLLIILPNIKSKSKDILLQIFSYFNYGFIYEIEGEFYIYGFDKEVKFEDGLMIKLYLPKSKFSMFYKFLEVFNLLFEYLEIPHHLFLYDLVDSKELIKSVYGNIEFLKQYNPLKNLKWNKEDKIWLNHKIFTQKFEPIYPDLFYNEEDN